MPNRHRHLRLVSSLLGCLLAVGLAALLLCSNANAATATRGAGGTAGSIARLGSPDPLAQLALQQAELSAGDGAPSDAFGYSVAISGDTALVGAPLHEIGSNIYQGAAYVFTRSGSSWTQQAELVASDGAANDQFGVSVAISGDTALVGAPFYHTYQGAAYLFTRSGSSWTQQAELVASDRAAYDEFGESVALDADVAVIGAPGHQVAGDDHQGAAYVFTGSGTSWSQQAELTASDGAAWDSFGWSVALSGGTVLVGAPVHPVGSNTYQGAAYVFTGSGTSWSQQAELTAGDGAASDEFGHSVAIFDDTALVGAPGHQGGTAYVFTGSGSTWGQQAELAASDNGGNDSFGYAVAISGDSALVGALAHTVGSNVGQGVAYLFAGSGWTKQAELESSDGAAWDYFGWSVALDGGTALIGAKNHQVGSNADQGSAYVELLSPVNTAGPLISGNTAPGDTLTCSTGSWTTNPTPSYAYQWLRDGNPIGDATDASYVVQAADCEHSISCQVTATDDAGSASAISNGLSVPAVPPANTEAPIASGDIALGDSLSCSASSWTGVPTPTLAYQWLRDGLAISGATDDTYTVTTDDQGHLLSCEVTAANDAGTLSETSNLVAVAAVLGAPSNTQAPVVAGKVALGQVLTCSSGSWSGTISSLAYQWLRAGVAIADATSDTYRVAAADCGRSLSCIVTATNGAGQTSVASNSSSVAAAPLVSLGASHAVVLAGRPVVLSGAVRNFLAPVRTLAICRRLHGRLIVLRRLTLTKSGIFRCTWKSHRGGLWRFVASYTAAGHRFTSTAVSVAVHKR